MFDANLESGETFRESKVYEPGSRLTLAKTPWGLMGLTVCYDLRFPNLYRHLAVNGAKFFSIPAAFLNKIAAGVVLITKSKLLSL